MKRFDDWQPRLIAYLHAVARRPFEEGKHDCAMFCAGAIRAMTGIDLAWGWRGYSSTRGGLRKLKAAGHGSHVDLLASMLEEIPPAFALPGDAAAVAQDGIPALGIVQGARIYVAGPQGLLTLPRTVATRAFRV